MRIINKKYFEFKPFVSLKSQSKKAPHLSLGGVGGGCGATENYSLFKALPLLLLTLLFQTSCSENNQDAEADVPNQKEARAEAPASQGVATVMLTPEQFKSVGVELVEVTQKPLTEVVNANGYLKIPPQNKAEVSAFMGGMVKDIKVIEGEKVKKGQTLALLEHPDFIKLQEQYAAAYNQLNYLQKEFERQKTLREENVNSGKIFEQSETNLQQEKAKVKSLENQLRMLGLSPGQVRQGNFATVVSVKTPIEGYVSAVEVFTGSYVQPNQPLFEVLDNHHLHVDLMVYEKDLFKVKPGQKIFFEFTNQEGSSTFPEPIQGEVFSVGKAFENETKTVAVHAEIKNNDKLGLIPGMYVNAVINTGTKEVPAVPTAALINSGQTDYVFELKKQDAAGYHFERVPVQRGVEASGYTQLIPLRQKLVVGTTVAGKGSFFLQSAIKVEESEGHGH
ncbi:MAG: efflux RND transporter periplasmic adaptor subunit [Hymenobacteraceae bacterium]|nr:efflux RND transporter periplasmic adaptor subunit [Hymenobacteraceae bacterium]